MLLKIAQSNGISTSNTCATLETIGQLVVHPGHSAADIPLSADQIPVGFAELSVQTKEAIPERHVIISISIKRA
jgi:hypothetical protein